MNTQRMILIAISFILSSCISSVGIINFSDQASPRYSNLNTVTPPPSYTGSIRVVTYNIELCKNIPRVIKLFREDKNLQNSDILCLQEMSRDGVRQIANTLHYNYVYYPCGIHPGSQKDMGQAILSPWPIKDDKKILLPFASKDKFLKMQRIAVSATVLINTKEIVVFSIHLGVIISPEHRKEQIQTILDTIPSSTQYSLICGDFNTYAHIHTKTVKATLVKAHFKNATAAIRGTHRYMPILRPNLTLDYIFYKNLTLLRAGKVTNTIGDHLPVWAEFE